MNNGYPEDLQEKIVAAAGGGISMSQATRTVSVNLSSVKCYVKKADHRESLAPKKSPASAPKLGEKATKLMEADLKQRSFATLRERRDYVHALTKLSVSRSTIPYSPDRSEQEIGVRFATERDEFQRALWRITVAAFMDPKSLAL
jgi:transposase